MYLNNKQIFWLIFVGSLLWSLTMVKSGIIYSYGMGFWGPNGHDGVWHIALAESISRNSWEIPIFAGEVIKNYHLGFDLILSWLHKVTFIPIVVLYFQILPPILAFFIGFYSYKFINYWTKDKNKAFWGTFFVYFGGSWGWLVNLLRGEKPLGESMFWSQQSISTLLNPPYALSLLLIFSGLYYLLVGLDKKDKNKLVLATFLFGILVQIKVYAGILMLISLFVASVWNIFKREGFQIFKIFSGSLIISLLVFSPLTKNLDKSLIYKPFWFLETMMVFSDRLRWAKYGEAMVNYKFSGLWFKAFLAYFLAFLIFLIGNLGTRIIALGWLWKKRKIFYSFQFIDVLVVSVIFTGILIPTLFIQSGTSWNTIQFLYYSLTFVGILAGIYFGGLIKKFESNASMIRIIKVGLVFLTIPTNLGTLYYHYLPKRPPAMISKEELAALKYLSGEPYGIVLTQPFDKDKANAAIQNPPRPLYLYESTAYVSAFSGKPTYLEDQVNLEITGYDWVSRRRVIENYFFAKMSEDSLEFLLDNEISYIYVVKNFGRFGFEKDERLNKIFENDEIEIYRVKKH